MELLLLPGMDGSGLLFAPLLQALQQQAPALRCRVIAYPQHGAQDYATLGQMLETQLPASGQPWWLLAESFSGPLGIQLAASRPSGLQGLILAASFARAPRRLLRALAPLLPWLPPLSPTLLPPALLRHALLSADATPALQQLLQQALANSSGAVLRARLHSIAHSDARPQLAQLQALPGLYLQAEADRLLPAQCADEIRQIWPTCQLQRLTGSHCLLQTNPQHCATALLDFIATQGMNA